jgi:hypothetical protein
MSLPPMSPPLSFSFLSFPEPPLTISYVLSSPLFSSELFSSLLRRVRVLGLREGIVGQDECTEKERPMLRLLAHKSRDEKGLSCWIQKTSRHWMSRSRR